MFTSKRNSIAILMCVLTVWVIDACRHSSRNNRVYFYIPKDYTGWVNIISDSSSKNNEMDFDNGRVYIVSNPAHSYRVKENEMLENRYEFLYYYYDTNGVHKLKSNEYPYQNIFFERNIKFDDGENLVEAFSFYVSKDSLKASLMSLEDVPKNPLLE